MASTETVDDIPIFAAGVWNGITITEKDLDSMVQSYEALKDRLQPPLKLGHNGTQAIVKESGLPSIGWAANLKRVGNQVLGSFSNVPKVLADLIRKRAYSFISPEVLPSYKYNGQTYPWTLWGVAILGNEVPAIKNLGDISKLFGADEATEKFEVETEEIEDGAMVLCFSEDPNGVLTMTPDETTQVGAMVAGAIAKFSSEASKKAWETRQKSSGNPVGKYEKWTAAKDDADRLTLLAKDAKSHLAAASAHDKAAKLAINDADRDYHVGKSYDHTEASKKSKYPDYIENGKSRNFTSDASKKAWLSRAGAAVKEGAKKLLDKVAPIDPSAEHTEPVTSGPIKVKGGVMWKVSMAAFLKDVRHVFCCNSKKPMNTKEFTTLLFSSEASKKAWESRNRTKSATDAATEKDHKRIADIKEKSGGDRAKELGHAENMAKAITDPQKALGRAGAAHAAGDKEMADVFHRRHEELGGGKENPGLSDKEASQWLKDNPKDAGKTAKERQQAHDILTGKSEGPNSPKSGSWEKQLTLAEAKFRGSKGADSKKMDSAMKEHADLHDRAVSNWDPDHGSLHKETMSLAKQHAASLSPDEALVHHIAAKHASGIFNEQADRLGGKSSSADSHAQSKTNRSMAKTSDAIADLYKQRWHESQKGDSSGTAPGREKHPEYRGVKKMKSLLQAFSSLVKR